MWHSWHFNKAVFVYLYLCVFVCILSRCVLLSPSLSLCPAPASSSSFPFTICVPANPANWYLFAAIGSRFDIQYLINVLKPRFLYIVQQISIFLSNWFWYYHSNKDMTQQNSGGEYVSWCQFWVSPHSKPPSPQHCVINHRFTALPLPLSSQLCSE